MTNTTLYADVDLGKVKKMKYKLRAIIPMQFADVSELTDQLEAVEQIDSEAKILLTNPMSANS